MKDSIRKIIREEVEAQNKELITEGALDKLQNVLSVVGVFFDPADAVNAGAFGGSRQAVANYLAEEGLQRQLGDIEATGREAAFRDARAGFDADRQMGITGLGQLATMGGSRRAADIQTHSY